MIHLKTGEGIPSVLLLYITKCIILHRIQYHVSRFEHQNILCILAETRFMVLRRYIMLIRSFSKGGPILQIFLFLINFITNETIIHKLIDRHHIKNINKNNIFRKHIKMYLPTIQCVVPLVILSADSK
jgi:hypothetical protein